MSAEPQTPPSQTQGPKLARRPPIARGLPLIGNSAAYLRDPLAFLHETARTHGDVVELKLFGFTSYLLSHPSHIEQVLVSQARNFTKDRFMVDLRRLLGEGLLTSEGDFWKRQRRLAAPAFHRERIHSYAQQMVQSTQTAVDAWRDGTERDFNADMMHLTLDIVTRTLFSADVGNSAESVGSVLETVMEHYANPLPLLFPSFEKLPLERNRRFREARPRLDQIIYRIIRERRAEGARDTGDLLSMLLAAQDEDGSRMSDKQVRDESITIFLAGHETTALALSWGFYLLAQHPHVLAKLEAELRDVLGGRTPTLDDVSKLKYAEMIVQETLRLYPPAWSVGREAIASFEVGGYHLPKEAQIWMSQYVVHRDPRFFDDPLTFRPERWADGLAKRLPRFAYFPFGGGPRICIGNTFALMEAVLLLATIAQRYRLRLIPGHKVAPFPSITLRFRHGLRMRLEARKDAARPVTP